MAENNASSDGARKQSMVRLDIYVKRHPSLSSTEFHEFVGPFSVIAIYQVTRIFRRWSKVHGTLVKGWLAEKGIHRYTQYHTPPEMCTQALGIHDDANILDFDGHAEVVVPNIDVLKKLVEDNFFAEFAKPDEEALVDINSVMRTIGYEEIHVENGRAV